MALALGMETVRAQGAVMCTLTRPPTYWVRGPLVSVIVPTLNEERYLPAALMAIENQTYYDTEVIVVDNGSDDNTVDIAREYGARVVRNPEYNLALSRNLGAEHSSGEILVFQDADTVPEATVIERAVSQLEDGKALTYPASCCHDSMTQSMARLLWSTVVPVYGGSVGGGFFALPRAVFDELGGFNEECLPQEGCPEDTDLVRRVVRTYGAGAVSRMRFTYAATSARRQQKQGLLGPHWQERVIRGRELPQLH